MSNTNLLTLLLELSEQYKSLDPAARARYLAKLQVLGLKEADDPFATWNNSKFEDNMSLATR